MSSTGGYYPYVSYKDFKKGVDEGYFTHTDLKALIEEGYRLSSYYKDLPEDYSFQYLNVPEFQFNGRLHLHFVVFGMDYLIDLKELRQWWKSHGMGEMVHAYSLKKNPKDPMKWTWKNPRNRPMDHRNKDPVDYLKAYLLKAQYGTSVNYWTFNTRFYTNSRNFGTEEERNIRAIIRAMRRHKPSFYVYVKSLDAHNQDDPNIRYVDNKEYVQLAESLLVPAAA